MFILRAWLQDKVLDFFSNSISAQRYMIMTPLSGIIPVYITILDEKKLNGT